MILDINKVKPGMTVASSIKNKNGVVILTAGKVLDETMINALAKNSISEIDIVLNEKVDFFQVDEDIHTTISKKLKDKAITSLQKININGILESSQEIITAILNSKEFSYSLLEYKGENNIFNHSVRVAAFASVLAKYYNDSLLKKENSAEERKRQTINMQHLTTAALVHDLGKTYENSNLSINLNQIPEAFAKKLPGIKNIPIKGYEEKYKSVYTYCILNEYPSISSETKLMAILVDENENGTGPLQADKNFLNSKQSFIVASKIIRLCSFYDELLKKVIENNQPLENISAVLEAYSFNGMLDKDLTELFINHIPLYSVGVKVKLSDGRFAIIKQTFTESVNNYKPIVQVIPTNEIIDLRNETSLTVREICGNEISFAELVARQIIDMNNETTLLDEHRKAI